MEDDSLFYGHLAYSMAILAYFTAIWYILWPLDTFVSLFGKLYQEKSGNSAAANENAAFEIVDSWRMNYSK
jgi:hypothetical protein